VGLGHGEARIILSRIVEEIIMNVLILGLGQYAKGSGVSAALYFAKQGDDVCVTDLKTEKELAGNVKQLKKFKNVRFALGKHDLKDVRWADLIVRGPRVRKDSPEMKEAAKRKIPTTSDIALFLTRCPAPVVGITGTRGKSTTTTMTYEIVQSSKRWRKVWLGGNILVSPLTFLSQVKPEDLVVLELSSFQLEGTGDAGLSPQIAVWTNLMRDHQDAYPDMDSYAEAKAQIFRHQQPDDVVLLPSGKTFDEYADEAPGYVYRFGKKNSEEAKIVAKCKLKVPGEHNLRNAEIATAIALELGVTPTEIKKSLEAFKGLENRIQTIATIKGVDFVNDTTATTPDGTMAALNALQKPKRMINVIFGGANKQLEFAEVAKFLAKRKDVRVFLLPGTAKEDIIKAFNKAKTHFEETADLAHAVVRAQEESKKGDVVLLSPGCASFGFFKNEFDRGEQFVKTVKKLAKQK
jgi:UDP-N-acetylmuramoylalanine--D-glutamate ligase